MQRECKAAAVSAYHHPGDGLSPAETGWPLEAFLRVWASEAPEYHAHGAEHARRHH